jgi:hypothetical protein
MHGFSFTCRRILERVGLQRLEARVVHKAREVGVAQKGSLHFAAADRKLAAALIDAEARKDGVDDERLARVDRRRHFVHHVPLSGAGVEMRFEFRRRAFQPRIPGVPAEDSLLYCTAAVSIITVVLSLTLHIAITWDLHHQQLE